MRVATSAQIAELDRRATKDHGISVAQLMDAAGRRVAQAAEIMLREEGGRRVVVMAGRGSNGGDGLVGGAEGGVCRGSRPGSGRGGGSRRFPPCRRCRAARERDCEGRPYRRRTVRHRIPRHGSRRCRRSD
ncbi:MAG: hypothetical protein E6H05_10635 [Bacillati bacterium ANGP1]|uniref:YjeF N-terminal domain-containing protein n=1 Tax=Candidatus Segetimicrobium genomatis TaxID=2569760 RepID=A0A537INH1_9BACT|nr:MAG: hypothetical protein E6H05_10635 [Terrabacteria group bacterium ANGP1]